MITPSAASVVNGLGWCLRVPKMQLPQRSAEVLNKDHPLCSAVYLNRYLFRRMLARRSGNARISGNLSVHLRSARGIQE